LPGFFIYGSLLILRNKKRAGTKEHVMAGIIDMI